MKILKTVAGFIVWLFASSILSYVVTLLLNWLSKAFNINTTFGSVVFLVLTMPEVATLVFWLCFAIGAYFTSSKGTALALLVICGIWQVLTLLFSLTSVTTWVVTLATIFSFILVYVGKLKDSKGDI